MSVVEDFLRDGFARLELRVPQPTLDELDRLASQLPATRTPDQRAAMRSLGSLISVFTRPEFLGLLTEPTVFERFGELGFDDLRFSAGYLLSKPSNSPPTFWHQDWGFWDDPVSYETSPRQLGLLLYLQDVDETNGCPRFIPGSHRRRHRIHECIGDVDVLDLRRVVDPLHAAYGQVAEQVSVSAQRGELVLFDPRVLHGAHANLGERDRHGLSLWYFTSYGALAEPIRRFVSDGDPIAHWPKDARSQLRPWLPEYSGSAERATLCKVPELSRMWPADQP